MFDFDENLIRVTRYEVLGKLPPLLKFEDGSEVKDAADWEKRRGEIRKYAVDLQYGTQPPAPEVFRVEPQYLNERGVYVYRITAGTKEKQVTFSMRIFRAPGERTPIAVDGDGCFGYFWDEKYRRAYTDNGVSFCLFDRTELANDVKHEGRRKGPLYEVYPDYTFGALGAWAWGYSRCVDAILALDEYDNDCIVFTGHSRGGKTAMLAGILDERAAIVNPNETNAGSGGCYRIHMSAIAEDGTEDRNEDLSDMMKDFPYWFGEGMADYLGHEENLPFDCHFTKALIAPRALLLSEAASDIWTNPIGVWQTTEAAREVYRLLGCEEKLLWYFRRGFHAHLPEDVEMLCEVIHHFRSGAPLSAERYFKTPFPKPERI